MPKDVPIVIPVEIATDKPTRRMLGEWKKLHADFRHCQKRVWYGAINSSKIEKSRRRRQWRHLAQILEIEQYLIGWCARRTKHPDIWTPTRLPKTTSAEQVKRLRATTGASRRMQLITAYYTSRRQCRALPGSGQHARRQQMRAAQRELVVQIRDLERRWMVALFEATHPGEKPPAPLKLSTVDLRPRKVKAAVKALQAEVA